MAYVELLGCTNFSFLTGVSHPDDLIARASAVGVSHIGIADRDGVQGLVRAHVAAKRVGVNLLCGATISVEHTPSLAISLTVRTNVPVMHARLHARAGPENQLP